MADYKFDGKYLTDRKGSKIGEIDGDKIRDAKKHLIGKIDGNYLINDKGHKIAKIDGTKIINPSGGSKIATIDDVRKVIEGIGGTSLVAMWIFFVR